MKAIAVFPASRKVRRIEVAPPKIEAPDQVRIRILEVGVCGTDREICQFEYGTPPAGSEFLILGHEALGEVIEVGAEVAALAPGDLVVPMVRRPCTRDSCTACAGGRPDFCFSGEYTERGIKERHGFMTEQIVEHERYLVPVPRALRDVAVLTEPLTIAEKALIQVWQVQERLPWGCPHRPGKNHGHCRTAVALGAGPVGLLGALALRASDFETYVYSREAAGGSKTQLLESIGAHYVSGADVAAGALAEHLGGIDLVYEAAGASRAAFEMLQGLGPNSVFVFTGVPGRRGPVEIDTDLLMRNLVLRNQIVFGTVNAGRGAFEAAVRDIEGFSKQWPAALAALITGRYPSDQFENLLLGRPGGIKNTLRFAAEAA